MPKALRKGDCVHDRHRRAPTLPAVIWTVGHSDRSLETFVHLLQAHGVTLVVDVRKMPRSRHNPQFNRDTFPQALHDVGINYVDMPGLGGLRRPRPDSPNTGWRNTSFQGYADYMLTPEFEQSLQELLERARAQSAVLMCAEAVPWRCHRSLIADSLVVRDISVEHILSATRTQPHRLRPWAQVQGTRITYPPQPEEQDRSASFSNTKDQTEGIMPDPQSSTITRPHLIELLNEDLSREYQAIIAYVTYSQVLKGAQYMSIAEELQIHAGEELAHALTIAGQIDYLGGMPTVTPLPVKTSKKAEEMLRFDLDNENQTIANYRVRVRQCEALGEYAVAENIRQILVQEQEHQIDLATALGVEVPDVTTPQQRA